ncbi:hypothetical protein K469DRAFT_12210 [Zopfia rhizophila CBS 207.26]|uniref:NYN domain-containing protein n=1 Tax=Zopfia rhizophila CBS 207.26 TaxID=1314779 RepID=A0A6A6EZV8_9PEZI|nr:hypothetical protein K469DRAFT_12210 [Zopfia rhizophila CBS 207.26]
MIATVAESRRELSFLMPSQLPDKPWDFGPVLNLLESLRYDSVDSSQALLTPAHDPVGNANHTSVDKEGDRTAASLGDFSKIWNFLGVPADLPPPEVPPTETPPANQDAYNSDGAIYCPPAIQNKEIEWGYSKDAQASLSRNSLDDPRDSKATTDDEQPMGLSKRQKKRRSRSQKKALKEKEVERGFENKVHTPFTPNHQASRIPKTSKSHLSVSEDESVRRAMLELGTPAKKASLHTIVPETPTPQKSRSRADIPSKDGQIAVSLGDENDYLAGLGTGSSNFKMLKKLPSKGSRTKQKSSSPPKRQLVTPGPAAHVQTRPTQTNPNVCPVSEHRKGKGHVPITIRHQSYPISADSSGVQYTTVSTPLVPSQVLVTPTPTSALLYQYPQYPSALLSPWNGYGFPPVSTLQPNFQLTPVISRPNIGSHPPTTTLTIRHGEDRHWHFLLKLIHDFGEDKKWLVSPMQLSNNNTAREGIHVFVDASNIFIGFNDTLKRLQGIHPKARTQALDISFDSLVLLMERRRPVAKRVLVGSSPLLPAFETAKAVGYEVNILDKVFKTKELTERQMFFKEVDRHGWSKAQALRRQRSGSSSDSEMITPANTSQTVQKMVEQGVDEVVHMKMLESIVDVEVPSTIVLATGDAAEAEYSKGFMAQVKRALKKGWKVELISWKKHTSNAYRDRNFQARWQGKFKIIELDDYAEDLLDT